MIALHGAVSDSLELWRGVARECLACEIRPEHLAWDDAGGATFLFGDPISPRHEIMSTLRVPRAFAPLSASIACNRTEQRWMLLYELLWRLTHGEPHLLEIASDPLMHQLVRMHRAVRRASHKMKAFVRFRAMAEFDANDPEYVAWFEPVHLVVEKTVPFFIERFPSMRWSILTPDGCARWDRDTLQLSPGIEKHQAPSTEDALEDLWRTYYAGIFNPSRLNRAAMLVEMPKSYWKNLPEAQLIEELARNAPSRMSAMIAQTLAAPEPLPADLEALEAVIAPAPPSIEDCWDVDYDPGWREARRRADIVPKRWPAGLTVGTSHILAGVAGWTDPSLLAADVFYPRSANTPEERLRYYATQLPMVEVDATYYALPSEETSRRWVERTPDHFVFDVKAHALMTGHPTDPARLPQWLRDDLPIRLRAARNVYTHHFSDDIIDEVWRRFLSALQPLRDAGKLGAIMLQYPKWFIPSRDSANALSRARERLGDCPASVEVRHRDWLSARVAPRLFGLLRELQFTYVAVDAPQGMESSVPPEIAVTNPNLAIFRFHGRRESTWEARNDDVTERFRYLYDHTQLQSWLESLSRVIDEARAVHLTFNNNKWNYAITNAIEMNSLLAANVK